MQQHGRDRVADGDPAAVVRQAVVGAGAMGRNHARILSELRSVDLVGIVDADEERAADLGRRFGVPAFADLPTMLERARPDAVTLAAPTSLHHRLGLELLQAGVHLLVEKPMAASSAQCEELMAAAEDRGVVLAVGHVERFNPAVIALKRVVDEGRLGRITSCVTRRVGILPPRIRDAGIVLDLAIHDFDVCSYLLGRLPTDVSATGGRALLSDRHDHAEILLDYDGVGCFVQANWLTPVKIRTLAVTGEAGYAELDYITQDVRLFTTRHPEDYENFHEFVARFGTPEAVPLEVERAEPLRLEHEAFVAAVRGQDDAPIVTAADGLAAVVLAERVMAQLDWAARSAHHRAAGPVGASPVTPSADG